MTAQPTLHKHPIRGFIWGVVAGAGVGLLLMVLSLVPLSIPMLGVYTASVAVLGAAWGTFGPPRKAKGPVPTEPPASAHEAGPEEERSEPA